MKLWDFLKSRLDSRSLTEHIIRGIAGAGLAFVAVYYTAWVWPPLVLLPIVFFLWGGCPSCWVLWLYKTVCVKLHLGTPNIQCENGACAIVPKNPTDTPPT